MASSGGGTGGGGGVGSTELFWSLLDRADRKFTRLRDLPPHARQRNNEVELGKAFRAYTRLWKLQQECRGRLVEAGLKRWEVGEIASRIAQLYYAQYQRTAEAAFLAEAYIFYEAILTREYFKDNASSSQEPALATKQLRFLARFIVVCLLLNRREMVTRLVNQLRALVDECKRNFKEIEFKEWKHVVQEIVRFLKADTPFMNKRPLRYSFVYDSHPDSLSSISSGSVRRGLRLRDAILTSYRHNEVKFTELTLDTFRMLQCLEWEPCGSFSLSDSADISHNEAGPNRINPLQDIRDPALPPNPRKVILYHPSITHCLVVLATICEELPPDGILFIYLSASGEAGINLPTLLSSGVSPNAGENIVGCSDHLDTVSPVTSPPDSPTRSSFQNMDFSKSNHEACLWLGSRGSGGSNCLYPCDLIPFTRKPLFLVIDSNNSHAFKAIHGEEKGETIAMLLSPISPPPSMASTADPCRHQNGSYFTMFLTAPVQAFCFLTGSSGTDVDKDTYNEAEKLLASSLSEWEWTLVTSDSLHPVWIEALGDPFLRRLLLRFIFCQAALALYSTTFHHEEFLPACLPHLPALVDPESPISQSAVMQLAKIFNVTDQFVFSDGIVHGPNTDEPAIIKASDIHESHFSASNGC